MPETITYRGPDFDDMKIYTLRRLSGTWRDLRDNRRPLQVDLDDHLAAPRQRNTNS
jgi:hypothetical protein